MKKTRILALVMTILLLAGVFAGCAAKTESAAAYDTANYAKAESAPAAAEMPMAEPMEAYAEEAKAEAEYDSVTTAGYNGEDGEMQQSDASLAELTAKIIYSANLSLQTTEFDKAIATLENMVSSLGGFIENSNISGDVRRWDDGSTTIVNRWAYYTVRVPAKNFEPFLSQTNGLGNVLSTYRYAENVTSQYTDYEARLSSLRTQEGRLLEMLEKAEDVDSLIALESRLADVRYETESIERNLRNLDMQISYSTISIDMQEVEVYTPTVPVQRTFGEKLSDAFTNGWQSFARGFQWFLIDLVEALPDLLLTAAILAAIFFIVRGIVRKRSARKAKKAAEKRAADEQLKAEWEARQKAKDNQE